MPYKRNDPFLVLAESRIDDFQTKQDSDTLAKKLRRISYYVPYAIAQELCAEVREEVRDQWYTAQFWRCQRCMLLQQNGVPRGLATAEENQCCCTAIIKRYGHDLS